MVDYKGSLSDFFDKKLIPIKFAINMIFANVALAGNHSSGIMSNSIADFSVIKFFSVEAKPRKAPLITQVQWLSPPCSWIKCNSDGAVKGAPGIVSCGGIFRGHNAAALGCFVANLGISSALHAELMGAMIPIEVAYKKGWHNFWLECDSKLVIQAFSSIDIVSWKLKNRWNNCLLSTKKMRFFVSHIFREGNQCADLITAYFWFFLVGYYL